MKFFIMDFFSTCRQIRRKLRIWSHLPKKSVIKNFIFCTARIILFQHTILTHYLDKFWHVYYYHVYFFLRDFKICANQEQHFISFNGLAGLDCIYMEVGQHTYRAGWGCWNQIDSVPCDQKLYLPMKFIVFLNCPTKRAFQLTWPIFRVILFYIASVLSRLVSVLRTKL